MFSVKGLGNLVWAGGQMLLGGDPFLEIGWRILMERWVAATKLDLGILSGKGKICYWEDGIHVTGSIVANPFLVKEKMERGRVGAKCTWRREQGNFLGRPGVGNLFVERVGNLLEWLNVTEGG